MNAGELKEQMRAAILAINTFLTVQKHISTVPRTSYEVFWMEPMNESGSQSREESRTEPSAASMFFNIRDNLELIPDVKSYIQMAEQFVHKYPTVATSGTDLVVAPLIDYYNTTGTLTLDEDVLYEICHRFTEVADNPDMTVGTVYLVEKFSAPSEFSLDERIVFRPLSVDDVDKFGRMYAFTGPYGRPPRLDMRHWICEIRHTGPKNTYEAINRSQYFPDQIAAALALATGGGSRFHLIRNSVVTPYLSMGIVVGGTPFSSGPQGEPVALTEDGIQQFQFYYRKVRRILESNHRKYRHLQLPIRRLRAASQRTVSEDQFVDYIIGLERLLASDTPALEVTFRFRMRGAALLPDEFGNAEARLKLMGDLYTLRSEIVHGNKKATADEIQRHLPIAERVLKSILRWFMKASEKYPSEEIIRQEIDRNLVAGGARFAEDAIHDAQP
jgi:hypothetical protein